LSRASTPFLRFASFSETALADIVDHIKELIEHAPRRCIVCGDSQPLPLLKPVACRKVAIVIIRCSMLFDSFVVVQDLCTFQQIEFGLGVSLETELIHRPEVVDLVHSITLNTSSPP